MAEYPLPQLRASREEAQKKILAQINTGRHILDILQPAQSEGDFAKLAALRVARIDGEKWAKFTIDLLKTLFAELSIGKEFGSPDHHLSIENPLREFLEWMDLRLNRLDSILQRLPLFPLAAMQVDAGAAVPSRRKQQSKEIFIVHGHDEAAKQEVARFIEKLGLHPIILHEKPDKGKTIIEKFEHHSDVGFAVVLLTPDDVGHPKDEPAKAKPRARQNVVLELGFFLGKLTRPKVCALLKGDIELPNDYAGVLYKPMDAKGAWRFELATEINAAGIDVDLNNLK
jgi:predicted nucleotide-binding protein